ncbi:MAG TPA: hypothetical protein PKD54_04340 [Pirellulaceae bacterium]|mgnify:CR=1 FL=1|nr:hypothetical protein [Pirellulaceae bacterium]
MKLIIAIMMALLVCNQTGLGAGEEDPKNIELKRKLDESIIPSVEFRQAKLVDVVNFLVDASVATDPEEKGITILLNDKDNSTHITLNVRMMTLHDLIKYVCEIANLSLEFKEGEVHLNKPPAKKYEF